MGSYFSPDAILTESEKLPTTLDLTVPNLGHLEGNPGGVLASGTKLNLPLWLAEMLAVSQAAGARPMASLDVPPALGARVLNALKADPRSVDLRAQAMHYYALGARVLELFEEEELADVLAETFKVRAADIADHGHNVRGGAGEGSEFLSGLDEMERLLYRAAHDSSRATRQWLESAQKRT